VAAYGDFGLGSKNSFFKLKRQIFAQVRATLSTATAPATATTAPKEISETEEVSKYVTKVLKYGGIKAGCGRGGRPYPSVSEAIVKPALFLISEDRVGLAALFELLFCIRIVRIAVRMILQSKLAISALDLNLGRRAGNAQDLVIVTFAVRCRNKNASCAVKT
jgi:hypothetical protein